MWNKKAATVSKTPSQIGIYPSTGYPGKTTFPLLARAGLRGKAAKEKWEVGGFVNKAEHARANYVARAAREHAARKQEFRIFNPKTNGQI